MVVNPYQEEINDLVITRVFNEDVESDELVWHRDRNDRIVEILESDGWYFQFEDQLPIEMKKGDVLNIPKESYHRIIKGSNDLIVKIYES
jgi:quercetin dioxygenase-like cupin family protein